VVFFLAVAAGVAVGIGLGLTPGGALAASGVSALSATAVLGLSLRRIQRRANSSPDPYQPIVKQVTQQSRTRPVPAWRGEREALIHTVAAEVGHEMRHSINFLRMVFHRSGEGSLSSQEMEMGREEVDRLERIVAGLQRMSSRKLERSAVFLLDLCARVEVLLGDSLGKRRITLDVDPEVAIHCDSDLVTQVLVNLLSNALEAAGKKGDLGVAWEQSSSGGRLSVWDTGAGFDGEPGQLFAPGYTTKARGTGLGLAITLRLVRDHGWDITALRDSGRTTFSIHVKTVDIARRLPAEPERSEAVVV
jgi:two-component system sensor histidine kinase HydH